MFIKRFNIMTMLGMLLNLALLSLSVQASPASTKQIIWESYTLSEVLPHVDANTLVVLDLDHTLVRTKNSFGSTAWYYHERQANKDRGLSTEDNFDQLYPLWIKAQQYVELEPVSPEVYSVLAEMKAKAAGVMAMTAREPVVSLLTLEQLSDINIDFTDSPLTKVAFNFQAQYPTGFHNGVLFSGRNPKGEIFSGVMVQAKEALKALGPINKIVFIDDREDNIATMAQAASSAGLEYVGMRLALDDAIKVNFDERIANKQQEFLGEVLPFSVVDKILALEDGKALLNQYAPRLDVNKQDAAMQRAILQQHLFKRLVPDEIVKQVFFAKDYGSNSKSLARR
jgi:hypothetical protein